MEIRSATLDDVEPILAIVAACDERARDYAPAGWEPPTRAEELEKARSAIESPEHWVQVADLGGELAGYSACLPAALARRPGSDPRLAELARLYVAPEHWGSRVATSLHDTALAACAERGFTAIRLFTPRENHRARRFYEREGWLLVPEVPEPHLGLDFTEYRRAL